MSARLRRVLVALIVAPLLVWSAVIPREHVHESDEAHHRSTVHRHLHAHDLEFDDAAHAGVASDADHVRWIDGAILHEATYHVASPAVPVSASMPRTPPAVTRAGGSPYDAARPHGPPRACLALRAPPLASA